MNILAIETATEMCSVALWQDGVIFEAAQRAATGHSELLLGMVDEVLEQGGVPVSDCAAIAYGNGPGSFTALRIGIGVAQGIALGSGLPLIAVSSLQALAQRHVGTRADAVLAAVDARMGEVYWACFAADDAGGVQPFTEPEVGPAAELDIPVHNHWLLVGSGADVYRDVLLDRIHPARGSHIEQSFPRAAEVALIGSQRYGQRQPSRDAHPEYVRNRVAERPKD